LLSQQYKDGLTIILKAGFWLRTVHGNPSNAGAILEVTLSGISSIGMVLNKVKHLNNTKAEK